MTLPFMHAQITSYMSHSQALMVVGSPHEEHRTIMDAKVNDLWTTSMHSVCMV